MNNQRDVLVSIKAGNCGHCVHLEKDGLWNKIKEKIEAAGIEVYDIKVSRTDSKIDTNVYYAGLVKYQRWYPMFIFFTASDWEDLKAGQDIGDRAFVLNGTYENGKVVQDRSKKVIGVSSAKDLLDWISSIRSSGQLARPPSTPKSQSVTPAVGQNNRDHEKIANRANGSSIVPLIPNPTQGAPYIPNDINQTNYGSVGTGKMNGSCSGLRIVTRRDQ